MSAGLLRTQAVAILARVRNDMLSVVTMQAVEPWNAQGQANNRNFNVVGCMGSAASIGKGCWKIMGRYGQLSALSTVILTAPALTGAGICGPPGAYSGL